MASELTTCAVANTVLHAGVPPMAFSGTTTMSPGCSGTLKPSPDIHEELWPKTVPSARITKIAFFSARLVGPPACIKYHFAVLPGRYATAVGPYTCPWTRIKLGRFGIVTTSPERTTMSRGVFTQLLTLDEI